MGNAAFKEKDYSQAIENYTKALFETPLDHTILGNRAAAYHNLGNYAKAKIDAELAIKIKPDWSKAHQRKAMALQAEGDIQGASACYDKAVELDANNKQAATMKG
jgi:tetratricopeptide (TPR) repeat protein